jgi:hypothetical protein
VADNILKVGAEFDVGPIVAGAQRASASMEGMREKLLQVAQQATESGAVLAGQIVRMVSLGSSVEGATQKLIQLGVGEERVAEAAKVASSMINQVSVALAEETAETEVATVSMSGFERAAGYTTARLAGMEAGLGMASYPLARMAQFLPVLGPLWEIALPIAIVAAFIPEIEKLGKASLDLADAEHGVNEASAKQNDELMKLDEEYVRITQGPIAAYEKELRDIPSLSLDLSNETTKLTKLLEDESTAWTYLAAEAQHAIIVLAAIGTLGLVGSTKHMAEFAYSAKDAEAAIRIINDKVNENKDVTSALVGINMEIVKAEKYQNDEKEAGRNLDAARTQMAIDILEKEKQSLETQQKITADKIRNQAADRDKAVVEQAAREISAQEKLQETISKTAAVQAQAAAQATLETSKALPELSLPEIDAKKKAVADALDAERADELLAADQIYQIKIDADNKEIALYRQGTEEYRKAVATKAQDEATYDLQIVQINAAADEKKNASNRDYEQKYRAMLIRQAEDAEKAAERMAELEISEAKRAQEQVTEDQKRAMALRQAELKAAMTGIGAGPLTEALKDQFNDEQLKAYDTELARLNQQLAETVIISAQLGAKLAGAGILTPEEIERLRNANQLIGQLQNSIGQLQIKQVGLQAEMINSWQQIEQSMQKALNTGFNTFNQQFIRMMQTGQSFSSVMIAMWNSMVASFVTDVLKMGEQWLETENMKLVASIAANAKQTADSTASDEVSRLSSAKTAAAKAMASTPFPLDLIVGPLVFAAALAFKEGGIVPGDQMVYAHDQEMILPRPISSALQGAVPAIHNFNSFMNSTPPSVAGGGGNTSHVTNHYQPTINVTQSGGKMSVDEITMAVKRGMRSGALDMTKHL